MNKLIIKKIKEKYYIILLLFIISFLASHISCEGLNNSTSHKDFHKKIHIILTRSYIFLQQKEKHGLVPFWNAKVMAKVGAFPGLTVATCLC